MQPTVRKKILIVLLLLALTLGGITSARVVASGDTASQKENTPSSPVVVHIYYTDRPNLDYLARELDVWEIHKKESYIVTLVRPDQYASLTRQGYRLEIDAEETNKINAPTAALDPRYYYFDSYVPNSNGRYIVNFLQETNAAYPTLTELVDVGDAWQTSHGGYHRDMWVLRITNEDPAFGPVSSKPPFFLFANIHAREVATPEMGIRYIKYLLEGYNGEGGYNVDADATWLVNYNVVYVMLASNPDGRIPDELDINAYRRKNMDNDDGCSAADSWGVDVNRNSSFLWGCCGGSSGNACDETYRGPARGSEPETQAFQNYIASVIPDQNGPNNDTTIAPASAITTTGVFLSLHSYSDVVLWPWDLTGYPAAPNYAQMESIGRKMAYYNGYSPDGSIGYSVDGSTDQWVYGKLGVASFTIEMGSQSGTCGDFFPAYGCMDGIDGTGRSFWAENKPAFLYLHKIADTPYRTAYGPDAGSLFSIPGVASPGQSVQLLATVADHRYGTDLLQPVNAAEYFIGGPGTDGTGTAMSPADGAWGETSEDVQATFDTTGLASGKHLVLIHGRNSNGQWGPFTAMFLYIAEPGVSPVIEGYVRDAGDNSPLSATVTAGPFQAVTDPATGFYSLNVISGTYTLQASASGYASASVANVDAQDYQTVQQSFYLSAACTVFNDNVEGGAGTWTAQSPWAITTESSHSSSHSWTDSPGGSYANGRNISLTSQTFNLSGYTGVTLSFWHTYDTEAGWDYGYVEYSTNGGTTWTQASRYNGSHPAWSQEVVSLPNLDNISNARIRFRFTSDTNTVADGWHVDDIQLTAGGAGCITPLAPTADFTTNSPVWQGETMRFTDLTLGTPPLQHAWDFGDGHTSTASDPQHLYDGSGEYLVTLTVTNTLGSDVVTHTVTVSSVLCSPITAVDLTRLPLGTVMPGEVVSFSANLQPNYASKPYTYTVSYGGAPVTASSSADPLTWSYAFPATGNYAVDLSVWNCSPTQTVTATLPVTVADFGVVVEPEEASASGDPGTPVTYTLRVTNTGDLTDTFSVALSGDDWATDAPASIGPLASLAGADLQVVVHVPEDALAGASDVASVVVSSAHVAAGPFTATLTTTARALYGLELDADVSAQVAAAPGDIVTYTLRITNTGNAADSFSIAVDSDWPVTYTLSVGPLTPGGYVDVLVTVQVPEEAVSGALDVAVVTVTSQGNPLRKEMLALQTSLAGQRLFLPLVRK